MNVKTKFSKISDITIPECMFHPYELDESALNYIYSDLGGIIPSQVMMVTGMPGSGKTTLAAFTGSLLSQYLANTEPYKGRPTGPVFLISREMSDFQIKMLSQKVSDFDDMILLKDDEPGFYQDWLKDIYHYKPSLIILDSIQKLSQEMGGTINKNQVNIVGAFKLFARKTNAAVMLIGHCTKDDKYIGPSFLQHEVDTHMHITVDKTTNDRIIKNEKNRYGSVTREIIMKFTQSGLLFEFDPLSFTDQGIKQITTPEDFHKVNQHNKRITTPSTQSLFKIVFGQLKEKYTDRIKKANKIANNLALVFDQSKSIKTEPSSNTLYFGLSSLKDFNNDTNGLSDTEYNYMNILCKTREDKLIWLFIREFVKLFESTHNSIEFTQKVYVIAKENKHLFSDSLSINATN